MLRQRPLRGRDDALALYVHTARSGFVMRRAVKAASLEVVKTGEIVLASPDTEGGYLLLGRFRLADGTEVSPIYQGLQPPTISIGEQGRDTQPFASSVIYDDLEGGVGVLHQSQRTGNNRYWWADADLRRRDQAHLLRAKRNMGAPPGITTEVPVAGGVYNNRVWVAWNQRVRQWADAGGGTVNLASSTNTSPITVTTAVTHGFVTGWSVTIAGHLVNTNANGTWTITVTGPTTFTLTGTTGNGVGGATGTVGSQSGGWTNGAAATDRVLAGSLNPTNNPVEWEGGWFWPLGAGGFDYLGGTGWVHVTTTCIGFLPYAGSLWLVDGGGQVRSTNIGASAAAAAIAAGTFGAAHFTDRVRVSDRAQGLALFTTADASADVVPYVIGYRQLYQVDPASYVAQPAGPQLAPHRYPMRAAVLGSDNTMYLAQGLGVTSWTGDLAQPIGLDLDDGVPLDFRGGITALANGGLSLFALADATRAEPPVDMTLLGSDETMAGILPGSGVGMSCLLSREPAGWHVRAVADVSTSIATMLFMDAAETTYRVWFSWGGVCYSIVLEQGFMNPLEDPAAEYEPVGSIFYSITDFNFKEHSKLALMAELRTSGCSAVDGVGVRPWIQYDGGGAWHQLRADDGSWTISTDGRHQYLLGQNPDELDPLLTESPPVGKRADYIQFRLDLTRGVDTHRTPVVVFAGLHAVKTTRPLRGWQFTIDVSRFYSGLTPWGQRNLLLQLMQVGSGGLLHFAHLPANDGPAGTPDVRAVKMVRFSGLEQGSLGRDFRGRVSVMLSEVILKEGQ